MGFFDAVSNEQLFAWIDLRASEREKELGRPLSEDEYQTLVRQFLKDLFSPR